MLRVAAGQAEALPGEVTANAETAARLATEAAERGAALVVLPELFLPAYHPDTLAAAPDRCDVVADVGGRVADGRLDPLRAAATGGRIVIVVGASVRRPDGRRTLSALVVDRAGGVRAAYDKQFLWGGHEQSLFSPGTAGASITVDSWQLGLGICYDGCFPEHGRAAALAGAHGYLCPSGYVEGSQRRRDVYYGARALDNTMYVAFANAVGGTRPWRFNGGAALYDPEGQPLARAGDEGEALVLADFVPEFLAEMRSGHTMLADWRAAAAVGAPVEVP